MVRHTIRALESHPEVYRADPEFGVDRKARSARQTSPDADGTAVSGG